MLRSPACSISGLPNLEGLLAQLRAGGVTVEDEVTQSEYGAFGWCLDGEGNRVELWQPPPASAPA